MQPRLGTSMVADEFAHNCAVLFVADGLHPHEPAILLGLRLTFLQNLGQRVDSISVKCRIGVPERLQLQVRDGTAGHVRRRLTQNHRVDRVSYDNHPAMRRCCLGIVVVRMERMLIHRD